MDIPCLDLAVNAVNGFHGGKMVFFGNEDRNGRREYEKIWQRKV
jgi:hypothetical protein